MFSSYSIVNIAAYKFITFDADEEVRLRFQERCLQLDLKGTILLSPEGINLFLAGVRVSIDNFLMWLKDDQRFTDIEVKESLSETQPFHRMLVKLKPEIITMRHPLIKPELARAPVVTPSTLKRWLDAGQDDNGRPVVMLDTRNGFEVDVGTFNGTVDFRIDKFSDFPKLLEQRGHELEEKTVVTFCTGGIRCEKAAIHMQSCGFKNVYQLEGGILKYFEVLDGSHFNGNCFVFDHRRSIDSSLEPTYDLSLGNPSGVDAT